MECNYSKEELERSGIYIIRNKINNKIYLGSSVNMNIRFIHHKGRLLNNMHKNSYLQNSVNKYGIENFRFEIVCYCTTTEILEKEDYYLKFYNVCNPTIGYNINPSATGGTQFTKETIEKRTQSLKETYKKKSLDPNFKGYNTKANKTSFQKGIEVWNKGRKYNSTDHLKVPKKKKADKTKLKEIIKEKQLPIMVFDINKKYLKTFRYIEDLVLASQNDELIYNNMILRNKEGRNGYNPNFLSNFNIRKSCNYNIPYKGLYFQYQTINVHNKQDELLETPEEDNQQPSLDSNIFEGSTTNSQVQTDNAEDSNANTSFLQ